MRTISLAFLFGLFLLKSFVQPQSMCCTTGKTDNEEADCQCHGFNHEDGANNIGYSFSSGPTNTFQYEVIDHGFYRMGIRDVKSQKDPSKKVINGAYIEVKYHQVQAKLNLSGTGDVTGWIFIKLEN